MTRPGEPRFSQLVDWVEGRLNDEESDEIARVVEVAGPQTEATVQWIRDFVDAGQAMPLARPPADVSEAARQVFRRRLAPWAPQGYLDAELTFDSRGDRVASGMRSGSTAQVDHLVFENELVRLLLDVSWHSESEDDQIDVRGMVTGPERVVAEHLDLVFTSADKVRHTLRCLPGGRFEAIALPDDVDAMWVSFDGHVVRAGLQSGDST